MQIYRPVLNDQIKRFYLESALQVIPRQTNAHVRLQACASVCIYASRPVLPGAFAAVGRNSVNILAGTQTISKRYRQIKHASRSLTRSRPKRRKSN